MLHVRDQAREGPKRVRRIKKDPVKLTALLYLKDALQNERYEECTFYIQQATAHGAQAFEIEDLLEDPRREPE